MTATITFSTAQQQLVARDENGKVLAAIDHDSPITAGTDSHDIARMVFDADEILSVDHDGEFIHVNLDAALYASRE